MPPPPPPPPNPPPPPPPPTYALPVTILAPLPLPVLEQQPDREPGPGPGPGPGPAPPLPQPPPNVAPVPLQSFNGAALPVNLVQVAAPVPVFVLGGKLDAGGPGASAPGRRASSLNARVAAEIRDTLVALASLNAEGLARQFESLLAAIPVVGPALAAAVGVAVAAIKLFADAVSDAQRRLVSYSPQLAVATAQADVRQTFGDIQRAQQLESGLARFTEAESRLSQKAQDIEADILEQLIPIAEKVVVLLTGILLAVEAAPGVTQSAIEAALAKLPEPLRNAIAAGATIVGEDAAATLAPLAALLQKIEDNTRKKEPDTDVFTDELFGVRVSPAGFIPPPRVAGFTGG